ncbi:hypothetical protein ACIQCF_08440 [Streptomyces sp. NPDC088353]|uniref:hypothetical protein n=1 Tax=Streptomyces sp. NPDC088353 TaxID=3365855 RepID=UPI00381E0BCC
MNGNPLYHWIAPAVSTAFMLPIPVARPAGWTPPWMRERQAGMRLRAYGFLCCYALMLATGTEKTVNGRQVQIRYGTCGGSQYGWGRMGASTSPGWRR